MANWSIRILNVATFPYTWDLVDAQMVSLLNQAYDVYQQTGDLTAPVLPTHNIPNSGSSPKGLYQPVNSFRRATNGSQKKRERRKRAAEAAVAMVEAAAEAAAVTADEAADIAASGNVQSPDPNVNTTHTTETGAEEQSLRPEVDHTHLTAGWQSLGLEDVLNRVSCPQHPRPTSALSPPLSPAHEMEAAHVSGFIDSVVFSPIKSSNGKTAIDADISGQAAKGDKEPHNPGPSSPAPSSVTLEPVDDKLADRHVNGVIDPAEDEDGIIAQLEQAKKKPRNKKGKKNKAKSKAVQSDKLQNDAGSGQTVEFEIELGDIGQEHPDSSNGLAPEREDASIEASSSDSNRFDLSQGTWSFVGPTYAMFRPVEGGASFHTRTPRVERYMRQQERLLAARAKTEELQKEAKVKHQVRKARQLLLRRDHIAENSPLLRAMGRPRNNAKKQVKSQSQSCSTKLNEEVVQPQIISYYHLKEQKQELEEKVRKVEYKRDIAKQRDIQRVVELPDDDECGLEYQLNSGNSSQDHRFDFDIDGGGDDDSVDSCTQEHPESIAADESGEVLNEAAWAEKASRKIHHLGLSFEFQTGAAEPYRFEALSSQAKEEYQNPAENDSLRALEEDPNDDNATPHLGSPVSPMFVPRAKQDQEFQNSDSGMTLGPDRESVSLRDNYIPGYILDDEQVPSGEIDFPEGNQSRSIYPEYGLSQEPVFQPRHTDNEFILPVAPVSIRVASKLLSPQLDQDEDSSERGTCAADMIALETAQRTLETGKHLREGDGYPSQSEQSATEAGYPSPRSDQRGRRSRRGRGGLNDRGNYAPPRGSYRGNHRGSRNATIIPHVGQAENHWANAVQASDGHLTAQRVARRIALEQDMQAKGTTYTDYATPIEDSYIQLDENRKPVDKDTEQIVYSSQSKVLIRNTAPALVQEVTTAGPSDAKIRELRDADSA